MGDSQSAERIADGHLDAYFYVAGTPVAAMIQLDNTKGMELYSFSEDEINAAHEILPYYNKSTIPAGTYRNQSEDFEGLNVGSMHLITNAETDPDLIYQITRTLYENRDQIAARHPAGRYINESNVTRDTGTEFHPGAIRYYREIGIWAEN